MPLATVDAWASEPVRKWASWIERTALGNAPPNSVKFFAAREVSEQAQEWVWLAKVTNALNQHWQKKNSAKRPLAPNGPGATVTGSAMAG